MDSVATVLGLLAVVTLLSVAAKRISIPYPTLMVLCGLGIALFPGLPHVELNPDIVLLVFLPPLMSAAAYATPWHEFRANIRPISLLAIGLVLATTTVVAVVAHAAVPGMPWAAAFALGALVSPPDAISATAVTQGLGVPRRITVILEGESLINDATGLVAYRVAVIAAVTGFFSPWHAFGQFVTAAVGGIAIGFAVGWLVMKLHKLVSDDTIETTLTLLTPYAAYLPAEALHCSGVLATVTTGIYISRLSPIVFKPSMRLQAKAVWEVAIFLLNGVTFVLIGLQLPQILSFIQNESPGLVWTSALLVCLSVVVVRMLWVYPAAWLPRLIGIHNDPIPRLAALTVIGWAGMRGVVSLAAALALPHFTATGEPFPYRDLITFLVFCVILSTLVLQSLTLPALVRWLKLSSHQEKTEEQEGAEASIESLNAAIAYLQEVERSGEQDEADVIHLREVFERQRTHAVARGKLQDSKEGQITVCRTLYDKALAARRRRLLELRDAGHVTDEAMRRAQREIDLEEARLGANCIGHGKQARVAV